MTTLELREQMMGLRSERALASAVGVGSGEPYMQFLETAYEATRRAYVGAAVTEIATLRAQLSGPQQG